MASMSESTVDRGRVCARCEKFRHVHNVFWIQPGIVKSLCNLCCQAGYGFTQFGQVIRAASLVTRDERLRMGMEGHGV